ncbi:MAG: zf-HC2 domain-containing protein [Gemmatimonadota bacterium]
MTDCSNVEMRERLPELLHDALSGAGRAEVEAHLASCSDCAEEFALLQAARRTLSAVRVPVIDIAAIAAALPRPRVAPAPRLLWRRSPTVLRLAAAISFISIGGISVAIARSYMGQAAPTSIDSLLTGSGAPVQAIPVIAANVDDPRDASSANNRMLIVHPSISALDDADLESLLGELDNLEAAPLAEPETTPGGRVLAGAIIGS